jgi:hypothetical protein
MPMPASLTGKTCTDDGVEHQVPDRSVVSSGPAHAWQRPNLLCTVEGRTGKRDSAALLVTDLRTTNRSAAAVGRGSPTPPRNPTGGLPSPMRRPRSRQPRLRASCQPHVLRALDSGHVQATRPTEVINRDQFLKQSLRNFLGVIQVLEHAVWIRDGNYRQAVRLILVADDRFQRVCPRRGSDYP